MRPTRSIRLRLAIAFLLVSGVTAVAVAAWVIPAADRRFAVLERDAMVGKAIQAAVRVARADSVGTESVALTDVSRRGQIAMWLVSSDGRDIARSTVPGLDRRVLPGAAAAVADALAGRRSLPPEDARAWVVALPVVLADGTHAAVLAYAPSNGFGAHASHVLRRQLLLAAGLAMVVAAVVGFLIATRIGRRVRRIACAAERIADGDFGAAVGDRGGDEIAALAGSVDAMRQRLAASFADLARERERLAFVLDRLDEGVLATTAEGDVRYGNPAAARLLGGARPTTVAEIGRALGGGDDVPALLDGAEIELEVDGRWLRVVSTRLSGGPPLERLIVLVDRTADHHRQDVERRFIANASHELRTPLAAIVAAVDVLQSGAKDDPVARDAFLDDVQREAARLDRLTQALLTVARIGAGELAPRCETLEAANVLARVATLMAPLAAAADVRLEATGAVVVSADSDLLEQVLIGLVGNAVKETPRGGAIALHAAPAGSGARITVADTGAGIAAADLPRVFDRFYQVDRSRKGGGFGLGLATCREFVAAMGGTVALSSAPGSGTLVTIDLRGAGASDATTALAGMARS